MMKASLLCSLGLLLSLSACNTAMAPPPDTASRVAPALTSHWQLETARELGSIPAGITLQLRPAATGDSRRLAVSGHAGVNHYTGSASSDPEQGRLQFGPLASTRRAGPAALMAFEQAYLARLAAVVSYELAEPGLVLRTLHGDTLHFTRQRE